MDRDERFFWVIVLFFLGWILGLAAMSWGQSPSKDIDLSKSKLVWTWEKGMGGDVSVWRARCGPATGNYTLVKDLTDPPARSLPLDAILPGPGTYVCAVEALNEGGTSGPGPEVSFRAFLVPQKVQTLEVQTD